MKQRKLVIGLLIMVALVVSTFTFAFWNGTIDWNDEVAANTIEIGSGRTVTVDAALTLDPTDVLVPVGKVNQSNEANAVTQVNMEFEVDWADTGDNVTSSTITVTPSAYTLGTLTPAEILSMFTFTVTSDNLITNGATKTIVLNIEFTNEPLDQAMYDQVANGTLTFTVTFAVATVNPS